MLGCVSGEGGEDLDGDIAGLGGGPGGDGEGRGGVCKGGLKESKLTSVEENLAVGSSGDLRDRGCNNVSIISSNTSSLLLAHSLSNGSLSSFSLEKDSSTSSLSSGTGVESEPSVAELQELMGLKMLLERIRCLCQDICP